MGEIIARNVRRNEEPVTLDTFGGKVHVSWDPQGAVSPMGQLPFFIEFLKVSGRYDNFIKACPSERRPALIRGDIFLGNEGFLAAAESRSAHYLTKLRLTVNVKKLIERLFFSATWFDAGHGYEGAESELKLDGWTRSRRVVVTRRLIKDNIILVDDKQLNLAFIDTDQTARWYEYAVLVTDLPYEVYTIAQLLSVLPPASITRRLPVKRT